MNFKDLMLDDYVLVNTVNGWKRGQVMFISQSNILVNIGDDTGIEAIEDDVKPIEIEEDFLFDNGFKTDDEIENRIAYISDDGYIIFRRGDKYCNSYEKWYLHIDNVDFDTILGCEITYVHEYQHMLNLVKIDKTLVV